MIKLNNYKIPEINISDETNNLSEESSNIDNNNRRILIYQKDYNNKRNKRQIDLKYAKTQIDKDNNIDDIKNKTENLKSSEIDLLKNSIIKKDNKDFKTKSKLETSCSIKNNIKEMEYLPYNNNLSFLDSNSILNSPKIQKSINNNNQKSSISEILEKKNKLFEYEYENKKQTFFLTNVLYKNKNAIIECPLLLKKNELYILNPIINEPLFFNSESNIIKNNNINNNMINDTFIKDEKKILVIENRYNLSNPLFYINFDLLSCKLLLNKKTGWIKIIIIGYPKSLNIFITNKEKYDNFIYLLNETIFKSEGYNINLFELSLRKTPIIINHNFIKLKEFESIAKTGDLLLFKSTFCTSKLQRLLSGDTYDHIALIEKKNGELSLYQSSMNGNIDFLVWDYYIDNSFYLYFDLVTYRRLNIESENEAELENIQKEIVKNFEDFVKETSNKNYYLSIKNLVCCSRVDEKQRKGEWGKMEGFSCSSLAYAFYNKIGAIKYDRNIHSIRPGDFQSNKNILKFNKKFSLGPEKIIEFND
jgi:hypothetical protein